MFDFPILLLTYNRTSHLEQILTVLKKMQVSTIYLSSDGPKDATDAIKVAQVRKFLEEKIDWTKSQKKYNSHNLGCRQGVSQAITWFFEHVDSGIILEDDCLPDESFFPYVSELLSRYKNDERVLSISGDLVAPLTSSYQSSYFFSQYAHVWGWATWKRAWELYAKTEQHADRIQKDEFLKNQLSQILPAEQLTAIFQTLKGKIDTWDYIWKLTHLLNHGLAVLPKTNLVANLGFGNDATHTKYVTSLANQPTTSLVFPLTHPEFTVQNLAYDKMYAHGEKKINVLKDITLVNAKKLFFLSR